MLAVIALADGNPARNLAPRTQKPRFVTDGDESAVIQARDIRPIARQAILQPDSSEATERGGLRWHRLPNPSADVQLCE
jgi:hypothetical protein